MEGEVGERRAIRYFNKEYCKASQHTYLVTLNDYDKLTGLALFLAVPPPPSRENTHGTILVVVSFPDFNYQFN